MDTLNGITFSLKTFTQHFMEHIFIDIISFKAHHAAKVIFLSFDFYFD